MISVSFINEYKEYDNLINFVNQQWSELDPLMESYNSLTDEIEYLEMFNESTKEKETKKKEVSKSFVDKVGDAVIGVVKKIREIIERLQKTIRERLWAKKTDTQKLQKIIHQYPELQNEIILSIQKGDLDIRDIKSMQDLTDGTIDLMEKLKMGKIDQSEFEKKFNKIYDRYLKYGKPVLEVMGAIGGAAAAVITLKKFKTDWLTAESKKYVELQKKQERNANAVIEIIQETGNRCGQNAASVSLRAWTRVQSEMGRNTNGFISIVNRAANGIERIVRLSDRLSEQGRRSVAGLGVSARETRTNIRRGRDRENQRNYEDTMRQAEANARGKIRGEELEGFTHNRERSVPTQ